MPRKRTVHRLQDIAYEAYLCCLHLDDKDAESNHYLYATCRRRMKHLPCPIKTKILEQTLFRGVTSKRDFLQLLHGGITSLKFNNDYYFEFLNCNKVMSTFTATSKLGLRHLHTGRSFSTASLHQLCSSFTSLTHLDISGAQVTSGLIESIGSHMTHLEVLVMWFIPEPQRCLQALCFGYKGNERHLGCQKMRNLNFDPLIKIEYVVLKELLVKLCNLHYVNDTSVLNAVTELYCFNLGLRSQSIAQNLQTVKIASLHDLPLVSDKTRCCRFLGQIKGLTADLELTSHQPFEERLMYFTGLEQLTVINRTRSTPCDESHFHTFLWHHGHKLLHLSLSYYNFSNLRQISCHCTHLVSLKLELPAAPDCTSCYSEHYGSAPLAPGCWATMAHLETLHLKNVTQQHASSDVIKCLLLSPNLSDVNFTNCTTITDDVMYDVIRYQRDTQGDSFTNLHKLALLLCPYLSVAPIYYVVCDEGNVLRELMIRHCAKISANDMADLRALASNHNFDIYIESRHENSCPLLPGFGY